MSTDDSYQPTIPTAGTAGSRRTKMVRRGIISAVGSRGIAAVGPLLLVPITYGYVGTSVYGLWMAVISLTSMAIWADLGLGNGLMTRLSHALATGDSKLGQQLIASAYGVLGSLAALGLLVLALTVPHIPWESVLNVQDQTALAEAPRIALIVLGAFILNVPLSLIQRIQYAHQQVSQSNAWLAIGSLTSAALAWVAVVSGAGVIPVVAAVAAGPVLGNVLNSLWFFRCHRDEIPRFREMGGAPARSIVGLGGRFLLVTFLSALALNIDTLIVSHTNGLADAALFAVTTRAMSALGLLVTLVNLPLWPANADALALGDIGWVKTSTRRMSTLSAIGVGAPALMVGLLSGPMFRTWLGSDATLPSAWLVILLGIWWTLAGAASPFMMVLNAGGSVRPQLIGWSAYLLVSTPLKIVSGIHFGLEGVAVAAVVSYSVCVLPATWAGYRAYLAHVSQRGIK